MNYVILHGTPNNIEKGEICDDAISSSYIAGPRDTPWDYRKSFTKDAESVLWDGNYFSEEDDGINDSSWTEEKRNHVYDKWLGLIDIIDKQLEEKGRFDIDIINYFSSDSSNDYKEALISSLENLINQIKNDEISAEGLVNLINFNC